MKLLEIKNVKKSFGDLQVLKNISLSVEESEVISILGPSGSGKSTLLRCMSMLEKIDGGSMSYCGTEAVASADGKGSVYADKAVLKSVRSSFGMVFQNFNLFPHYSVLKNIIDAPISVQKRDKAEVIKEAGVLLKKMGLGDKGDYYPYQLSGGQQQRVSIGRALMNNPALVLADEPTGNLDSKNSKEIVDLLRTINKENNQTVIIITHDDRIALSADRIIAIEDGKIVKDEVIRQ